MIRGITIGIGVLVNSLIASSSEMFSEIGNCIGSLRIGSPTLFADWMTLLRPWVLKKALQRGVVISTANKIVILKD